MKRKKQSSFCQGRVLKLIKCEADDKCHPANGIVAFHHKEKSGSDGTSNTNHGELANGDGSSGVLGNLRRLRRATVATSGTSRGSGLGGGRRDGGVVGNREEGGLLLNNSSGDDLGRGLDSSGALASGGDSTDRREVVSLGHDGGRCLSGGLLSESEGRQNSQDELGEVHFVGFVVI
ncbi:hypothetical protein HG531_010061 [Fusarium graminearum]|nr:hypothetical protein HG531_010061 [Fusarium graminearum]